MSPDTSERAKVKVAQRQRPGAYENYLIVRERFGLKEAHGKGEFYRMHKDTDFQWRGATIEEALAWAFARYDVLLSTDPNLKRELMVIEAFCDAFGISEEDLMAPIRDVTISKPRQMALCFCRGILGLSLIRVATTFKRDHTTVVYANKKYIKTMELAYEKHRRTVRSTPNRQQPGSLPDGVHDGISGNSPPTKA